MTRPVALLAASLALLLVTGCAFLSGGITYDDPFQSQAERRLTVRVENLHSQDVRIVAMAPGRRFPLGQVEPRTVRQFSVAWSRQEEVRFQIEPLAGSRHTTQSVPAGPGDFLWLQVAEPASRSSIRR
jgi:glucose dehydrogenase